MKKEKANNTIQALGFAEVCVGGNVSSWEACRRRPDRHLSHRPCCHSQIYSRALRLGFFGHCLAPNSPPWFSSYQLLVHLYSFADQRPPKKKSIHIISFNPKRQQNQR